MNDLQELYDVHSYTEKLDLARDINTPAHILEELSNDKSYWVPIYVAVNPSTPIHILEKFYNNKSRNFAFKLAIAENPSTPAYILEALSIHYGSISRTVMFNSSTPEYVIEKTYYQSIKSQLKFC